MSQKYNPRVTPWQVDERDFPRGGAAEDKWRFLLRYATLAPSSHNAQPWTFAIQPQGIAVRADFDRRTPVADPGDRDLVLSIGTALMNLQVAAAHFGFTAQVEYLPRPEEADLMAEVRLSESSQPDRELAGLFGAIVQRRTNRRGFSSRPIAESDLEALRAAGNAEGVGVILITAADMKLKIGDLVAEVTRAQFADPAFRQELARWMRHNWTMRGDGIPGYSFGIPAMISPLGAFIMRSLNLGSPQAKDNFKKITKAAVLAVLHSNEDTPQAWLGTGEVLGRFLLAAKTRGIDYSFFNQPCEFPSVRPRLRELLDIASWPQIVARLGYALSQPPPSPRRPLPEVLMARQTGLACTTPRTSPSRHRR